MSVGFHEGELAVQQRAGVGRAAERLSGMLAPADLSGGLAYFLAERSLAVITARDGDGRLWSAPLVSDPGFLVGHGTRLDVRALPRPGDALVGLAAGQPIGLIAIELATRRRVRVNGALVAVGPRGFAVDAVEAFGNCPKYIQARDVVPTATAADGGSVRTAARIEADVARVIEAADTFFLGTAHPDRGVDASHRGGAPGFVRVTAAGELWWPDYPGNNMFNSLGNLAVDPSAALLFIDFATGATVQLFGRAELEWTPAGAPGDDGGTGRRVRFTPQQVRYDRSPLPVWVSPVAASPHNPLLTT